MRTPTATPASTSRAYAAASRTQLGSALLAIAASGVKAFHRHLAEMIARRKARQHA